MRRRIGLMLATLSLVACAPSGLVQSHDLVVGVLLPLSGDMAPLAQEELNGIDVVVGQVNSRGGIGGRRVRIVTRDVTTPEAAPPAVASLKAEGAQVVMGGYSSDLSIPAAHATSRAGLVYWETGAVADQLTGEA